ncbi:MAG: hypothetical protein LBJ67_06635 [Planctomycetaceae bacterium]|jgi:hypothetical protein|nr:hypothetical protein [Planctomycetaceae bacterium]
MLKHLLTFLGFPQKEKKRRNPVFSFSRKAVMEQLEDRQLLSITPLQIPDLDAPTPSALVSSAYSHPNTSDALVRFDNVASAQIAAAETLTTLVSNVWIGGSFGDDSSWQNSVNWSLGHVPTAQETIEVNTGTTLALNEDYTVANLNVGASLVVSGHLTITGNANLFGSFQLNDGASLLVTGNDAILSFAASSNAVFQGGSLIVANGAFADLSNFTEITGLNISAANSGSKVDITSLSSLSNGNLSVTLGGTVENDSLAVLNNVNLTLDATATFDASTLVVVYDSAITSLGGNWAFSNLALLDQTDVTVYGGTTSFLQVYSVAVIGNTLEAVGPGAVLDLSNVSSITDFGGADTASTTITAQGMSSKVKLTSLEAAADVIFSELDGGDLLFGDIPFPIV